MDTIKCEKRTYSNIIDKHDHGYSQLIIPVYGELKIDTDKKQLSVNDKNIFLLPPKCIHQFNAEKKNEFIVLDIASNDDSMLAKETSDGGVEYELDERWKAIRYLLLSEMDENKGDAGIKRLYSYFSDFIHKDPQFESIEYIKKNFSKNIEIKMLAEMEHYNENYYCEWFKKKTDKSLKQFIKNLRIQEGKKLLADTDYSLIQIANMVGYEHHSSFTRVFKEIEGMTPSEFKKNI